MAFFADMFFLLLILSQVNNIHGLRDCSAHYNAGSKVDGVYEIQPAGVAAPFEVYCEMSSGAWTWIQRRQDGHVDFYKKYAEYQAGFGILTEEHWLGNDNIHSLTNPSQYRLRIDFTLDNGTELYAEYSSFSISSQADRYRLNVSGFSGTVNHDALAYHNGYQFYTYDNDDSYSCASQYHGAWWYNSCMRCNLNGRYKYNKVCTGNTGSCIDWYNLIGSEVYKNIIRKVTMKIRESNFTTIPGQHMSASTTQIMLTGDLQSENSVQIPDGCADEYGISLSLKSVVMEGTVVSLLGSELCAGSPGMSSSHIGSIVTTNGSQGQAKIQFSLVAPKNVTGDSHEHCANAVGRYIQDHANWFQPIIDVVPSCPVVYFTCTNFDVNFQCTCNFTSIV